jgi:hypothetical protein
LTINLDSSLVKETSSIEVIIVLKDATKLSKKYKFKIDIVYEGELKVERVEKELK